MRLPKYNPIAPLVCACGREKPAKYRKCLFCVFSLGDWTDQERRSLRGVMERYCENPYVFKARRKRRP